MGKSLNKLVLLFTTFIISAYADSPIWKISKGSDYIYIGGTIHVLKKSDYPLPSSFDKAYRDSDTLVFEIDIQKSKSKEFEKIALQKFVYKNGKNLKQHLNDETYKKLNHYFYNKGMVLEPLLKFKPGMIMLTMTIIELQSLGFTDIGVDDFYNNKATKDNKIRDNLESIDEQLDFLASMGNGKEDMFINYSLNDIKNIKTTIYEIKNSWLIGDIQSAYKAVLMPMKNEYPYMYNELVVQRNNNWLPKIKNMLEDKDIEFVLVGYFHLVGDDGLLAKLKNDGYKIKMVK